MTTETELTQAFSKAANDLAGFTATANFAPFRDLKVTWERTTEKADFHVSDYLEDAPYEVLEGLAEAIIRRINGEEVTNYPESVNSYLMSKECRDRNVETYVERSRTISDSTGLCKDLSESMGRLVDAGLVPEMDDVRLYWSKRPSMDASGQTSKIMRVVIMNSRFDSEDVPDFVLDYCLLHQMGYIVSSFGCGDMAKARELMGELEDAYPRKEDAEDWLEDHCIRL